MSWLAGLFTKIIAGLGALGLQALFDWIKEKYEDSKRVEEQKKALKEYEKAVREAAEAIQEDKPNKEKIVEERRRSFENLINS